MADLSPAAQAVLDAAYESMDKRGYVSDQVAAALRAAGYCNRTGKPPMITDFRALCAEFVQAWDDTNGLEYEDFGRAASYLVDRTRAALAQEGQGPTVMQIIALADEIEAAGLGQVDLVRAALARWGGAAPQPVPVTERLPVAKDCDEQGRCWMFEADRQSWLFETYACCDPWDTHWLPANALPQPEVKHD